MAPHCRTLRIPATKFKRQVCVKRSGESPPTQQTVVACRSFLEQVKESDDIFNWNRISWNKACGRLGEEFTFQLWRTLR